MTPLHYLLSKITGYSTLKTFIVIAMYSTWLLNVSFWGPLIFIGGWEDQTLQRTLEKERWKTLNPSSHKRRQELLEFEYRCALQEMSGIPNIWKQVREHYNNRVRQGLEGWLEQRAGRGTSRLPIPATKRKRPLQDLESGRYITPPRNSKK